VGIRSWIHSLTSPKRYSESYYYSLKKVKLVLIVNNELKMGKGKIAAQVGHASVKAAFLASEKYPAEMQSWLSNGQKKVVLKAQGALELEEIIRIAKKSNLPTCLIRDAGKTQIPANSLTVGGIGPAPSEKIDELTKHLKLM